MTIIHLLAAGMSGWWLFLLIPLWLLPIFIGANRRMEHEVPLTIFTAVLGWTVFGWIAAMAWSVLGRPRTREVRREQDHA